MQGYVLKALGAISGIANMLLDLNANQEQTLNNIMKAMALLMHTCTDSVATLHSVNHFPLI